jgi:hypothetical protein
VNGTGQTDRVRREAILERLYRAYLEEGLYRGVASRKDLGREFGIEGPALERNLEYLQERGLIRMHKIEDLVSITTGGVDWMENPALREPDSSAETLARIEKLLEAILARLDG